MNTVRKISETQAPTVQPLFDEMKISAYQLLENLMKTKRFLSVINYFQKKVNTFNLKANARDVYGYEKISWTLPTDKSRLICEGRKGLSRCICVC